MANKHLEKKLFNLTYKEERSNIQTIHFQNKNYAVLVKVQWNEAGFVSLLVEDKQVKVSRKAIWQLCLENFKVMDTLWVRNSISGNFPKLIIWKVDKSHARRCLLQIFNFEKEQAVGQDSGCLQEPLLCSYKKIFRKKTLMLKRWTEEAVETKWHRQRGFGIKRSMQEGKPRNARRGCHPWRGGLLFSYLRFWRDFFFHVFPTGTYYFYTCMF